MGPTTGGYVSRRQRYESPTTRPGRGALHGHMHPLVKYTLESKRSKLDHAAVNHQLGPDHELGLAGGQVEDGGGNLVRMAEPLERDLLGNPLLGLPGLFLRHAHPVEDRGRHRTRTDRKSTR